MIVTIVDHEPSCLLENEKNYGYLRYLPRIAQNKTRNKINIK